MASSGAARGAAGSRGKERSILDRVSSSNPERVQMATLIQDDLKPLGIQVDVVPLEFRSLARPGDPHARLRSIASSRSAAATPTRTPTWPYGFRAEQSPLASAADEARNGLGGRNRRLMKQQLITPRYEERKRFSTACRRSPWRTCR